jgi:hypothetical protein
MFSWLFKRETRLTPREKELVLECIQFFIEERVRQPDFSLNDERLDEILKLKLKLLEGQ